MELGQGGALTPTLFNQPLLTPPVSRHNQEKNMSDLIISKSRTKAAATTCNVSGDFYGALDHYVRRAIAQAESRASANGRKTLRPADL